MVNDSPPKRLRWFWRFLVLLEWIVAALLALECFEAGRAFIAERMYKDYFEAQNRKVYRMVPAENLAANPVILDSRGHSAVIIPPTRSSHDRQKATDPLLDMVLRGEMQALFSEQGELIEAYGEPLIEQDLRRFLRGLSSNGGWASVIQAIREGKEAFQMQCVLTWGIPVHYAVSLTKITENGLNRYRLIARDISVQMPVESLMYGDKPGPNSPWEIPFFRYKKNYIPTDTEGFILQTNEHGFRDHPVTLPKPEGVFRIVCIGGSTTEEGNTSDSTYPKLTERKLTERFGPGRIEVINAGICGINSYSMRRRFNDYLALEPDLIIVYGEINDTAHMHFQFWLEMIPRWKKWLRHSYLLRRYAGFLLLPSKEELEHYLRDTTFRNFLAMRYAAQKQGAEMAWASFAYPKLKWYEFRAKNYFDVNMRDVWHGQGFINFKTYCRIMDMFNHTGKAIAEEAGIPWLPVAEYFISGGTDHFFDICHMTPLGLELKSSIFTELLAQYLRSKNIL